MPGHDARILQQAYDDFAAGDVAAVLATFADDVTFEIPGEHPASGTFTGHEEVLGFFAKLAELTAGTFFVTAHEIFDNRTGTVVALCTIGGDRHGRSETFDVVHVWRFADGKAANLRDHNAQQAALNAFFS